MKERKKVALLVSVIMLLSSLVGCGQNGKLDEDVIVIGSKSFTENNLISEVYALALEKSGYKVERRFDLSGSLVHQAITGGDIDLYPEYTGTALLEILQLPLQTDPEQVYQTVKKGYKDQFNLIWLEASPMSDGAGLVIYTPVAEKYKIKTISDLQAHATELRFASQGEFDERGDGLAGLSKLYGPFKFKESNVYDASVRYDVLENGDADVSPAYTTEAKLSLPQFTLLVDDKHMWPPYNVAPVIRNEVLEKHPDIADVLNKVSAQIDTKTIIAMNAKVDLEHVEYEEVAAQFMALANN